MSTLVDRLHAQARIYPVRDENRVRTVKKLDNGSLEVTLHNGTTYAISADDELFQAFVVWTALTN